jgi:predicted transcriptional regulator
MRHWTQAEIEEIAALLGKKKTASKIAEIMGRSKSSIVGLVHRTPILKAIGFQKDDIGGTREIPIDTAEANRLLEAGMTWREMGNRLGVSATTIRRRMDTEYRKVLQKREAERRERGEYKAPAKIEARIRYADGARAEFKREIAMRLAEIPADTRDLTGRIAGDPIPGDPRAPWRPQIGTSR